MIRRPPHGFFRDAQAIDPAPGKLVGEQRVATVKIIVAGEQIPFAIEKRQHRIGLRTDGFGREIKNQRLTRLGLELDVIPIRPRIENTPEGHRQWWQFGNRVGDALKNLRQIIHEQFHFAAVAFFVAERKLVGALRQVGRCGNRNPSFRPLFILVQNLSLDLFVGEFQTAEADQIGSEDFHLCVRTTLNSARFESRNPGLFPGPFLLLGFRFIRRGHERALRETNGGNDNQGKKRFHNGII